MKNRARIIEVLNVHKNLFHRIGRVLLLASSLVVMPAAAEHQQVVGGMVVNIGIVAAEKLAAHPGEAAHGSKFPAGSRHLLVSVSDARTGAHLVPVRVVAEVTAPNGSVQKKPLVLGGTAGIADHSEIFDLGWAGKYRIRITVEPKAGERVRADFVWTHAV